MREDSLSEAQQKLYDEGMAEENREIKEKMTAGIAAMSKEVESAGHSVEQIDENNIRIEIDGIGVTIQVHKNFSDRRGDAEFTAKVIVGGNERVMRNDYSIKEVMGVIDSVV